MSDPAMVRAAESADPALAPPRRNLAVYLLLGMFFGLLLIKSEVVSWYRIQEMFRFQSFHMYGVLGSGVATAALSLFLLRRFGSRFFHHTPLVIADKPWRPGMRHHYWIGGTIFGLGWGLTGACPGPIFALLGYGVAAAAVVLLTALLGARAYAALQPRLPH